MQPSKTSVLQERPTLPTRGRCSVLFWKCITMSFTYPFSIYPEKNLMYFELLYTDAGQEVGTLQVCCCMKVASQLRTGAPGGGSTGIANPSVWLKARAVHLHPRHRKMCGCSEKAGRGLGWTWIPTPSLMERLLMRQMKLTAREMENEDSAV